MSAVELGLLSFLGKGERQRERRGRREREGTRERQRVERSDTQREREVSAMSYNRGCLLAGLGTKHCSWMENTV